MDDKVSEETFFKCPICDKLHTRKYNLERHIKLKHGSKEDQGNDEVLLFMFLNTFPTSSSFIENYISIGTFLLQSFEEKAFDILWQIYRTLVNSSSESKLHILFELFHEEHLIKVFSMFPNFVFKDDTTRYKKALKEIVCHLFLLKREQPLNSLVNKMFLDLATYHGYEPLTYQIIDNK